MKISRKWAMPSADTFDIPPIGEFVKSYLRKSNVSIDPFSRNKRWATYTNDLNPNTAAEYHKPARVFLRWLRAKNITIDLVIFDPPYSRRQVMECYDGIGVKFTNKDSQEFSLNWKVEREIINHFLPVGGIVLSFGWNSNGMKQSGNYIIDEVLLVAHGGAHNDTICIAERKISHQDSFMDSL